MHITIIYALYTVYVYIILFILCYKFIKLIINARYLSFIMTGIPRLR